MELSFFKLLLVVVAILILFGAGKLPKVMEDLGKGLKSFKKAVNDNPAEKTAHVEVAPPVDVAERKDV